MSHDTAQPGEGAFPTTHWSLVARAGGHGQDMRQALAELLAAYLPAIRAHLVRRKGVKPQDADDVVQGFLLSKVLEHELVAAAQPQKGRFRTYLLTALDRYLVSQVRHDKAQKRAPAELGSLNAVEEPVIADRHAPTPGEAFDVAWARQVLQETVGRMREECRRSGRQDVWGVFEARTLEPILGGAASPAYDELARRFNLQSPAQACNLLVTAKRMFQRCLREVIGRYERDPAQIEAEIADLQRVLGEARR